MVFAITVVLSYGAAYAIGRDAPPGGHDVTLAALKAVAPGPLPAALLLDAHPALLAALDILAALALAALPLALLAAAARLLAWRRGGEAPPWASRALLAATAPVRAWLGACEGAVGAASGRPTARGAALAAALGAYVAYAIAHLAGAAALLAPHPDAVPAALAALLPGHAAPPGHLAARLAMLALDVPVVLSALAASPLLASAISRAALSGGPRPWRGP